MNFALTSRQAARTFACVVVFATIVLGTLQSGVEAAAPGDPNEGHTVTLCHATGSDQNPFTLNTVDVHSSGLHGGHAGHPSDIIPAFTFTDSQGVTHNVPAQNMLTTYGGSTGAEVLANGCNVPEVPAADDVCPNIDGIQDEPPTGMHLDPSGNCVASEPPASDVCPNLEGAQATVPTGLVLRNGACVEAGAVGGTHASRTLDSGAAGSGGRDADRPQLPFTGADERRLLVWAAVALLAGAALHLGAWVFDRRPRGVSPGK